jgi:hypothetical protein
MDPGRVIPTLGPPTDTNITIGAGGDMKRHCCERGEHLWDVMRAQAQQDGIEKGKLMKSLPI